MTTELTRILKYDEFEKKFNQLKSSKLVNLPNDVEEFINEVQMYEGNLENQVDHEVNRYHLYNDVFTGLRHKAALIYFKTNVDDLDIDDERIIEVYKRMEEGWISNYEDAMDEIREFVRFTNLLKLI